MPIDELIDRALLNELTLADHDQVIGHHGDLREHVAADQHGLAAAGEVGEDVANPADSFGVEAVGRLVKNHRSRVTEHDAGQTQSLLHTERVPLHPAIRRVGQPNKFQRLVNACRGNTIRHRNPTEVVTTAPAWVDVARIEQRTDFKQRIAD